jgi:hypothetical protein
MYIREIRKSDEEKRKLDGERERKKKKRDVELYILTQSYQSFPKGLVHKKRKMVFFIFF